jgi:hypothetical protein
MPGYCATHNTFHTWEECEAIRERDRRAAIERRRQAHAEKIARELHPDGPNMAQVMVYRAIATAAARAGLEAAR